MKNFNVIGVHWKIRFFWVGGGEWKKKQCLGVNRLKRVAWIVCRFKRRLGKKEGVMFLRGGGWDPNVHYELEEPFYWNKYPNNNINYNWHIVSKKKKSGIPNPKNSNYQIGKSLKLWSVMITIWEEWQNCDFFSIIIIHICEQKHSLQ